MSLTPFVASPIYMFREEINAFINRYTFKTNVAIHPVGSPSYVLKQLNINLYFQCTKKCKQMHLFLCQYTTTTHCT